MPSFRIDLASDRVHVLQTAMHFLHGGVFVDRRGVMRSASWYRQRAVDCLEGAAKIFGDADRTKWLRAFADRWFQIARGCETPETEHQLSPVRRPDQRGAPHNEPHATASLGAGMNV